MTGHAEGESQPAHFMTGGRRYCHKTQPAREANIAAICEYIAAGCKPAAQTRAMLGIELEQHIVHDDLSAVAYDDVFGSRWILEQYMRAKDSGFQNATYTPEGALIGAAREGATLTLEPAAQLELSAGPYERLADAFTEISHFQAQLESLLKSVGERPLPVGYHPSARATDLKLIPKVRYDFMNAYLSAVSPFGPCMMRGSASTQVSIDFADEADCVRKLRLADFCVPLFSLICDNSPVFEGAPRTHELVRTEIWRHLDPDRAGIARGSAAPDFTWRAYAEWILDMPAIVAPGEFYDRGTEALSQKSPDFYDRGTEALSENSPDKRGLCCCHVAPEAAAAAASPHVTAEAGWHFDPRPFGEIYATEPMTQADVEHALSMAFPDVRLKRYLEIRPADALPPAHAVAFAALVKGLFYFEASLAGMETLFAGLTAEDIEDAKTALMAAGYAACVYGRPAGELTDALFALAREALGDEACFLEPLESLSKQHLTPANIHLIL